MPTPATVTNSWVGPARGGINNNASDRNRRSTCFVCRTSRDTLVLYIVIKIPLVEELRPASVKFASSWVSRVSCVSPLETVSDLPSRYEIYHLDQIIRVCSDLNLMKGVFSVGLKLRGYQCCWIFVSSP